MSYSYRPKYPQPLSPVKVGEEHEVTIEELSRKGEGVAKIQGLVIFIPETKVGDQVKIRITRVSRRYATAETV
jgi:predicted RNA-binding protein with TRAM domain